MISVHLEKGRVMVRETRRPRRRPGFALIQLIYGGICNTDLELKRGYYGFRGTPGHEFVGQVIEADTPGLVGRRVVGDINLACGDCDWCRRGLGRHCPKRSVLGIVRQPGAFSELFTLPERNLHKVPDSLLSEHAVFAEPLAAACEIVEQVTIPRGTEVAVLGDGKLGLLIAQVLQAQGAEVHLFGRHAGKLRLASDLGIAIASPRQRTASRYAFTVDATGSAAGLAQAVSMTRPRGTVILKSTVHGQVPVDTAPVIVQEITLVGSRCGRIERALPLLRSGKVKVAPLVSDVMPLREAPRAFARAAERGVLKVLLASGGTA